MEPHIQQRIAHTGNYGAQRSLSSIQYLVIHYTANDGDTAKNNADYFAESEVGRSAHYFVDAQEVWRSVPDDRIAWHCGTTGTYYHPYCRNANSIGIELCSRKAGEGYTFPAPEVDLGAALAKKLMAQYKIPSDHVIRHYDVTHKTCPEPYVRDTAAWQAFKARLTQTAEPEEEEEDMVIYKTADDVPAWGKPTVEKLLSKGFLKGEEHTLDLEYYMLRTLVINDRAGVYDASAPKD